MNPSFRYAVPLTYAYASRLHQLREMAATAYMEWVPNVLLVVSLEGLPVGQSVPDLALSWIAFMSFYELGYMMNDLYSVRYDAIPRRRLGLKSVGRAWIWWGIVRLLVCGGIVFFKEWYRLPHVWLIYAVGVAAFITHNLLRLVGPKVLTFVTLATVRFLAPMFPILTVENLSSILFPALINIVLFRTLSYIDSKGMLRMPERRTAFFRVQFYFLALGPNAIAAVTQQTWIPVVFTLYFIVGSLLVWAATVWLPSPFARFRSDTRKI